MGFLQVLNTNGAAIWSMPQASGMSKNVLTDTSIFTNNSTLTMDVDPDVTEITGYEVGWHEADVERG